MGPSSLVLAVLALIAAAASCLSDAQAPTVAVGGVEFEVEVAHTPADRAKGLSGRDSLPPNTGMLFVFESGRASTFWMKGMRFPLDFVWIGGDCTVVDVAIDAPPEPGVPDSQLVRYEPAAPAVYTLEINAGAVGAQGIGIGDEVRFSGFPDDVTGVHC